MIDPTEEEIEHRLKTPWGVLNAEARAKAAALIGVTTDVPQLTRDEYLSWFRAIGVPPLFAAAMVRNVELPARDILANWLDRDEPSLGLYLWGAPGLGKTSAAVAVLKRKFQLTRAGRRPYSDTYFLRIGDLRASLGRDKFSDVKDDPVESKIRDVSWLVIDDFSAADVAAYRINLEFLRDLVCYRASNERRTIITTTVPPAALNEANPIFWDQVTTYLLPVAFNGTNRRAVQRQKINAATNQPREEKP